MFNSWVYSMKSKSFLQLIILLLVFLLSTSVYAKELSQKEALEFSNIQGQNLLRTFSEKDIKQKYQKLDDLFLNYVDLDYISRFVVGKYWRQMNTEQQEQYQNLFKRYATNVYKGFPLSFDNNLTYTITGSRKEDKEVFVVANIEYDPQNSSEKMVFLIEFRLHKPKDKIMITDIKIAESSLILSYRKRFYQMIADADGEIEWFLEDFELTTTSAEKTYALPAY